MKFITFTFDEGLNKGLRRFKNTPRDKQSLIEMFNVAPSDEGVEIHEALTSISSTTATWGGEGTHWTSDILTEDVLDGDVLS